MGGARISGAEPARNITCCVSSTRLASWFAPPLPQGLKTELECVSTPAALAASQAADSKAATSISTLWAHYDTSVALAAAAKTWRQPGSDKSYGAATKESAKTAKEINDREDADEVAKLVAARGGSGNEKKQTQWKGRNVRRIAKEASEPIPGFSHLTGRISPPAPITNSKSTRKAVAVDNPSPLSAERIKDALDFVTNCVERFSEQPEVCHPPKSALSLPTCAHSPSTARRQPPAAIRLLASRYSSDVRANKP